MKIAVASLTRTFMVAVFAAGLLVAMAITRGTPSSPTGTPDPSRVPAATSSAAGANAPVVSAEPAPAGAPTLTDRERRGQVVGSPRFGDCRRIHVTVDEATPTIELATATADLTVVATVEEIGGGRYNTPGDEVLTTADRRTLYDAYRPSILRVDTVVAGSGAASVMKVRLPGGKVGCDEYTVDGLEAIVAGTRYILFLDSRPDAKGNGVGELTIVRAWSVGNGGKVVTPADGELTIPQLVEHSKP